MDLSSRKSTLAMPSSDPCMGLGKALQDMPFAFPWVNEEGGEHGSRAWV